MPLSQVLVVVGEASGDGHAAALVGELQQARPDLRFFGMGGPKLAGRGVELLFRAEEISVMGVTEVLPKLRRILAVLRSLAAAAKRRRPVCAILVDVPDFNLRLARKLKRLGIPVAYYISPMVWAWRRGRVSQIGEVVDRMLCILPFEAPYYRRAGVKTLYVGSPVLEQVPPAQTPEVFRARLGVDSSRPTLALLPGSRASEISRILPALVAAAELLEHERPGLQVLVPVAPSISRETILEHFAGRRVQPHLIEGRAAEVVGASDVAVVASGTAVLEAGLMRRPLVVVYRVSLLNGLLGRLLLRVSHVSLVNLLVGRRLVPELLQGQMTPQRIAAEVRGLWTGAARAAQLEGLDELRKTLGEPGAARRAAAEVLSLLR